MFRASSRRVGPGGVIAVDDITTRSGVIQASRAEDVLGRRYLVAKWFDHWRVTYEDTPIGTFDDQADATRFACDLARMEAQAGVPTRVEVQAAVLETHHFLSIAVDDARPPRIAR